MKPANIILDSGIPYVVDFGLARVDDSSLTRAGSIMGSIGYMSPEQIRSVPADARSDIFSLGAVLYELCCSRRPPG